MQKLRRIWIEFQNLIRRTWNFDLQGLTDSWILWKSLKMVQNTLKTLKKRFLRKFVLIFCGFFWPYFLPIAFPTYKAKFNPACSKISLPIKIWGFTLLIFLPCLSSIDSIRPAYSPYNTHILTLTIPILAYSLIIPPTYQVYENYPTRTEPLYNFSFPQTTNFV